MIIKYTSYPNHSVKSKQTGREVVKFNFKGEYVTDDKEIIDRLDGHFDYLVLVGDAVDKEEELPTDYHELLKIAKEQGHTFEKNPKKTELLEILK